MLIKSSMLILKTVCAVTLPPVKVLNERKMLFSTNSDNLDIFPRDDDPKLFSFPFSL